MRTSSDPTAFSELLLRQKLDFSAIATKQVRSRQLKGVLMMEIPTRLSTNCGDTQNTDRGIYARGNHEDKFALTDRRRHMEISYARS